MRGSWKSTVMALAIAAMFLTSALPFSPSAAQVGDEPIYLRVGMLDGIKTLNPIIADDIWTWDAIRWLYDSPVYRDVVSGKPVPYIAIHSANVTLESLYNLDNKSDWEPLAVAGQMTVHYKFTGVKFHDGHPMDIDDILFSYGVATQVAKWSSPMLCLKDDGGNGTSNYTATHWLGIKKLSDTSLRFYLQVPFYNFVNETLSPIILPRHIWGATVSGQASDSVDPLLPPGDVDAWSPSKAIAFVNPSAVGSGAFKFENWTKGLSFKISTWREHFYHLNIFIDGVDFKVRKTAESSTGLWYDSIDYLHWSLPPTYVLDLINRDDISLSQCAERGFTYIEFNMRRKSFGYIDNDPAKGDYGRQFRMAVAMLANRKEIVERLLQGFGNSATADSPVNCLWGDWYNNSLPQHGYDTDQALKLLDFGNDGVDGTADDYKLTDPTKPAGKGNWWKNPDGSPIGSGNGGEIEILTVPADYDPIMAQATIMITTALQNVGINAEPKILDFGPIVERIKRLDYDMAVVKCDIETEPPSYLYDFFHSSLANVATNAAGYQNHSFDRLIEKARSAPTNQERQQAVKDCQASIAYDQPINVLYYKTNIEAWVSSRFVNWTVGPSGSIFSWRSLIGVHPHGTDMVASLAVETPVASGSTSNVTVSVTDQWGNPFDGIRVNLSCSKGNFTYGSKRFTGTTMPNGDVTTKWIAPDVPSNGTDVKVYITLEGIKNGWFTTASKMATITVKPDNTKFIRAHIDIEPDVLDPGETSLMTVTVYDQSGSRISGASVEADPSEEGVTVSGNTTTDSDGVAVLTLTASSEIHYSKEILFDISVFHPSYAEACAYMKTVRVLNGTAGPVDSCCPNETYFPIILGAAIIAVTASVILYFIFRKKRQK